MLRCQAWRAADSLTTSGGLETNDLIAELHLHLKHSEPVFRRIHQLLAPPWLASFSLSLVNIYSVNMDVPAIDVGAHSSR